MRTTHYFGLLVLVLGLGCASTYDDAYQLETDRLESQEAQRQASEQADHRDAQKYAAIVYFDLGSSTLSEDARRELRWLAEKLAPYPKAILKIQGFADGTGSEPRNQVLSLERSQRVKGYLMEIGIDPSRLRTEGFSSSIPAETNDTAKGRSRNRRVEVTVL